MLGFMLLAIVLGLFARKITSAAALAAPICAALVLWRALAHQQTNAAMGLAPAYDWPRDIPYVAGDFLLNYALMVGLAAAIILGLRRWRTRSLSQADNPNHATDH